MPFQIRACRDDWTDTVFQEARTFGKESIHVCKSESGISVKSVRRDNPVWAMDVLGIKVEEPTPSVDLTKSMRRRSRAHWMANLPVSEKRIELLKVSGEYSGSCESLSSSGSAYQDPDADFDIEYALAAPSNEYAYEEPSIRCESVYEEPSLCGVDIQSRSLPELPTSVSGRRRSSDFARVGSADSGISVASSIYDNEEEEGDLLHVDDLLETFRLTPEPREPLVNHYI